MISKALVFDLYQDFTDSFCCFQDESSHLVAASQPMTVALPPVNRQLVAVAAMNGHVTRSGGGAGGEGGGTDTPPPPCSTPPPTYEQAILGGACHGHRRAGKSVFL